jgi:hypothetical protein
VLAGIFENALRRSGKAFRDTLQSTLRLQWLNVVQHAGRLGACVAAPLLQDKGETFALATISHG